MTQATKNREYREIIEVKGHARPFWIVLHAFGGTYYQGEYETRQDADDRLEHLHNADAYGDYPDGSF